MIRKVVFHWDDVHGNCYDCGNPAAYTSDDHSTSPENLRCGPCAAFDAAHGCNITYLFDEEEVTLFACPDVSADCRRPGCVHTLEGDEAKA